MFNIPIIDISSETHRQSVVDREQGLYLGHPTTALLDDGKTIVCVYPKCHGCGQIVLKKSYDGGVTWTERLPVPASFSTSLEVPTVFKTYDRKGKCRLLMFSGLYPIRMSISEDGGDSWTELAPIGDFGGICAMGDMISLGNGEYMAFFHDDSAYISQTGIEHRAEVWKTGEGASARTQLLHYYSEDGGATWSEPEDNPINSEAREDDSWKKIYCPPPNKRQRPFVFTVYSVTTMDGGLTWSRPTAIAHLDDVFLCEPGAVFSPDRTQIAVLMRDDTHKHNSHFMTSADMGKSWSFPKPLPDSLTGDRHVIRYTPDGRLFITFRDKCKDSPTFNSWVGWVGTYDDIINGREGLCRVHIAKNTKAHDCGYAGVEILRDGAISTTSYGHFTEGEMAYVMNVRFKMSEIDEKLATLIK